MQLSVLLQSSGGNISIYFEGWSCPIKTTHGVTVCQFILNKLCFSLVFIGFYQSSPPYTAPISEAVTPTDPATPVELDEI